MSTRAKIRRDRITRLIVWPVILLTVLIACLCVRPVTLQSVEKTMAGSTIMLEAKSDFALVVDYEAIAVEPASFDKMDFSLAWLNSLQQEIGPTVLLDADGFDQADLSQFRFVILTQSTASHDAWTPKLRSFLERGGTLVLEMPQGALRTIASADGKGGLRNAQNITYAAGVPEDLMASFAALDLSNRTRVIGSAGPLDDSTTFLTIDGVPVVYAKTYATGHVITIDFNYGMLLTSMQQGRPLDDFSIRNYRDSSAVETSDLAGSGGYPLDLPLADAIERFVFFGILDAVSPVVGFWPFFDGMSGALIMTHRENGFGDRAAWMPEYEASIKASSSLFAQIPSTITSDGVARFKQYHTEIGLGFDLSRQSGAVLPVGPFSVSPFRRRLSLSEQADALRKVIGEDNTLLTAQAVHGLWGNHYTHMFRALAAAGFRADASYRSALDQPGYTFMTGLPFMPVDTNGRMFNILEFPLTHPDIRNDEDVEEFIKFLDQSAENTHECLSVSFDPDFFLTQPSIETFRAWKNVYRAAYDRKHWITSIQSFFRFLRARNNAELTSKSGTVSVGHKKMQILRIETMAPENGMTLSVPQTIGTKTFAEARRGIHRVRNDAVLNDPVSTSQITTFGLERVIVPLARGFNAIDVLYE